MRRTKQREAIQEAFSESDRPLAPKEVLEVVQEGMPRTSMATVYRNIRTLEGHGWLHRVELPGAADRYEVAGKGHHHHFHCRDCDRLFEVNACPGGFPSLAPDGFLVEGHEVTLYGLCPSCTPS